MGKHVI